MIRKPLTVVLVVTFLTSCLGPIPKAHAQGLTLPSPGTMVNLSPAFEPVLIKGLKVHPENPFAFDFIIDTGHTHMEVIPAKAGIQNTALKQESDKLIKYFLAALTIPEKDLWVNLSPYEKDRMIADNLGNTQMGQDMLAQDYILKQLTASLIYPEKDLGKAFWDKVYQKAQQLYGTTEIPVNTFNKVWIVADKADVFERGSVAYIVGAHLKVMLEEDYTALNKNQHGLSSPKSSVGDPGHKASSSGFPIKAFGNDSHAMASQIVRDIILPSIEQEVNQGKNFAPLRQMFYSMILASWYKMALKDAFLNQVYSDRSKLHGLSPPNASIGGPDIEAIYQQYLTAYKKGVFNYIKEDINQTTKQPVPRKYFSGGLEVFPSGDPAQLIRRHQPWKEESVTGNIFDAAVLVNIPPAKDAAMTGLTGDALMLFQIASGAVDELKNARLESRSIELLEERLSLEVMALVDLHGGFGKYGDVYYGDQRGLEQLQQEEFEFLWSRGGIKEKLRITAENLKRMIDAIAPENKTTAVVDFIMLLEEKAANDAAMNSQKPADEAMTAEQLPALVKKFSFMDMGREEIEGRVVVDRVSYDVPVREQDGVIEVTDDARIRISIPTIKHAVENRGKLIIIPGWIGRPRGKVVAKMSLRPAARKLTELLRKEGILRSDQEVKIIPEEPPGETVDSYAHLDQVNAFAADQMNPGDVIMLDNTRFNPGEDKNDGQLARAIGELADIYVQDGPAQDHRPTATNTAARYAKKAVFGQSIIDETEVFSGILDLLHQKGRGRVVYVLAGSKIETQVGITSKISVTERVIRNMINDDVIEVAGAMAYPFILAKHWQGKFLDRPVSVILENFGHLKAIGSAEIEDSLSDATKGIIEKEIREYNPDDSVDQITEKIKQAKEQAFYLKKLFDIKFEDIKGLLGDSFIMWDQIFDQIVTVLKIQELIKERAQEGVEIHLERPVDHKIGNRKFIKGKVPAETEFKVHPDMVGIPEGWSAGDIGPDTIKKWIQLNKGAEAVIIAGTLGIAESEVFRQGSVEVTKAAAETAKRVYTAGGDTRYMLQQGGIVHLITHASVAGGATLERLDGKITPGIQAVLDHPDNRARIFSDGAMTALIETIPNALVLSMSPNFDQKKLDIAQEPDGYSPEEIRSASTHMRDEIRKSIDWHALERNMQRLGKGDKLIYKIPLRLFDGSGSSFDLWKFVRRATKLWFNELKASLGFGAMPTLSATITDMDDPKQPLYVEVTFEKGPDGKITYVAPDYFEGEKVTDGTNTLNNKGRIPGGQANAADFVVGQLFGVTGIKITLTLSNPQVIKGGGLESSNAFNASLFYGVKELTGAHLSEGDLFGLGLVTAQGPLADITGLQGWLAGRFGNVQIFFAGQVRDNEGRLINPRGIVMRPLFDRPEDADIIAGYTRLAQVNYAADEELARTATLINEFWTFLFDNEDPETVRLEARKLALAHSYADALRRQDIPQIVASLEEYANIRDEITLRGVNLAFDSHEGKTDPEVKAKQLGDELADLIFRRSNDPEDVFARQFAPLRQLYERADAARRQLVRESSLYTWGLTPEIRAYAKMHNIAIFPLGAGGPGANLEIVAQAPEAFGPFFERFGDRFKNITKPKIGHHTMYGEWVRTDQTREPVSLNVEPRQMSIEEYDKAAIAHPDKAAVAKNVPGGIDLNRAKMQMNVRKEGDGVQMQFDPAMLERIRREGFDGLEFKIQTIAPVTNLPLLLGLSA